MNVLDSLSGNWANALGWTLVHSLWQSLGIMMLVWISLRLIPGSRARLRYAIISAALVVLFSASAFTFAELAAPVGNEHYFQGPLAVSALSGAAEMEDSGALGNAVSAFAITVEQNIPWIIVLWFAGFLFFSFRLGVAFFYAQHLRSAARPIRNGWSDYVQHAAKRLGICRVITLAESAVILTPIVIGYFKPFILVPVGMMTGLSTEQLETIFLHELAHIRRHDYLINFIQSIVETIFFFNPFVWMLSGLLRREREYCCDDLVLKQHSGAKAYAHALARLAETRLTPYPFALSLADNRNQLLNRIKRIMERSAKTDSRQRHRLVAGVLLASGLLCISWLGIRGEQYQTSDPQLADQDTVPAKDTYIHYSRKSIITIDENGQSHEQIIEELDTIPPRPFSFKNGDELETLSNDIEENIRMRFPDLFVFENSDLSQLMEEFNQRLEWNMGERDSAAFHFDFPSKVFGDTSFFGNREYFESLSEQLRHLRNSQMEHFRNFERDFSRSDGVFKKHEKTLREHLLEDEYLSGDERIESMEWSDDTFKVNGKSIKKADKEKYRELYDQFLNGSGKAWKME